MTLSQNAIDMDNAPALRAVPRGKNLISIASGKGGVGKTWFSVTLAHALARLQKSILLFDGDLGLANIDIQLGLMPEHDLGHVIRGELSVKDAVTRYTDGNKSTVAFEVLAGKSGSGSLASLRKPALEGLKDQIIQAAANYDHVLLDLSAGVDAAVSCLAHHDGRILVVVTSDPTSLTDAYAFIKLQRLQQTSADISVVVNVADSVAEGKRTYETLKKASESFLKFSPGLAGIIRQDRNVRDAIRHQTSTMTRHPITNAAADVEAIARLLTRPDRK